eukprot:1282901-Rhodomonas_salina.1
MSASFAAPLLSISSLIFSSSCATGSSASSAASSCALSCAGLAALSTEEEEEEGDEVAGTSSSISEASATASDSIYASAWPALRSVLGRHDLGLGALVERVGGRGVGGNLSEVPQRAGSARPRATIPDVADRAIAALKAEAELATEHSGRDEGLVDGGALGAEGEDLHDQGWGQPAQAARRQRGCAGTSFHCVGWELCIGRS